MIREEVRARLSSAFVRHGKSWSNFTPAALNRRPDQSTPIAVGIGGIDLDQSGLLGRDN